MWVIIPVHYQVWLIILQKSFTKVNVKKRKSCLKYEGVSLISELGLISKPRHFVSTPISKIEIVCLWKWKLFSLMFLCCACIGKTISQHYFISFEDPMLSPQLYTHHSLRVSLSLMTCFPSRRLPFKVPSGWDFPSKTYSLKHQNIKLFCMYHVIQKTIWYFVPKNLLSY